MNEDFEYGGPPALETPSLSSTSIFKNRVNIIGPAHRPRGGRVPRHQRRGRGHEGDRGGYRRRNGSHSPPPRGRGQGANDGLTSDQNSSRNYTPPIKRFKDARGFAINGPADQYGGQNYNQNPHRNFNQQNEHRYIRDITRTMGFKMLQELAQSDSATVIEKINQQKNNFKNLLEQPIEKKRYDNFALMLQILSKVSKSSFQAAKKQFLLEVCNSNFIGNLRSYFMDLPYLESQHDKQFNSYYWKDQNEFWWNFISFCECIINVSPSTAVNKCRSLIEATSQCCLDGLKEKHSFVLPEDYATKLAKIRESLITCDNEEKAKKQDPAKLNIGDEGAPPENFRELGILPTHEELFNKRPYLRPNIVNGAYSDKEHYLDVQFRLLREDCYGPLREGIHQYINDPKKKKYENIRVYQNVKFVEPYISKQKVGSLVLIDEKTMKRFQRVNWAHSKRFLFGSLVLFTKDNCKTFIIATIVERDEKLLTNGLIAVGIVNGTDNNIYDNTMYTMIESEVYLEPYYHVLKALKDPNFPEHMAMSNYIVNVQPVPEQPAYLAPDTTFKVRTVDNTKMHFTVLQNETWPSRTQLGLNETQYDAYKLALTHEFAVIQGPPGTGKTFLGVKIAKTLLKNLQFPAKKCHMLVICYTNHALDQFLENLLPVTQSMARIGGRSRSEAMEQININNLRKNSGNRSSYYHEQRMGLNDVIRELEEAQARVDSFNTGVLSLKTIAFYAEESKIVEKFYRESGIEDPLKYWLFENVDNVDIEPLLLNEQQMGHFDEEDNEQMDIDLDNDIYRRDDVILDDDLVENVNPLVFATTSFSIVDAENKKEQLLKQYHKCRSDRLRHELRFQITELYSQIDLFRKMIAHRDRAPQLALHRRHDLTTIPRVERWCLYFKWANHTITAAKMKIKELEEKVYNIREAYEEARMMVDLAILKEIQVVGMTTSGAARLRKLLTELAPPIVVVEEAAEVLEAHIVTSLTKHCQHLILIGDHQQLRPSAAHMRLARHFDIEVSLFERMIRNNVHSRRLGVQHRMRPEIAALITPHIYENLQNHPSVENFPDVRGVTKNLFFLTHSFLEQEVEEGSSRTNTQEADLTLRLANYIMQQGYQDDEVTILSAYSGQMFYMRKQRPNYAYLNKVKITVLDNYQGEESKIILLSLVRNNNQNAIGFLKTENRICVALSRAREGFYIFGNINMLKTDSKLWTNIAGTLEENGSLGTTIKLKCVNHEHQITEISNPDDFVKVPEGGCLLDCKYKLPCDHPCPRVCHAYDITHATIKCIKDCERKICEVEGHRCPLRCAVRCKPCSVMVEKTLPCNHEKLVPCFREPDDPSVLCMVQLTVTLPNCGHTAKKSCYMKLEDVKCPVKCGQRLGCGHTCLFKCHVKNDPDHERYICKKPCAKAKNGCTANLEGDRKEHQCLLMCYETCENCTVQVRKKRSTCTHSELVDCNVNIDESRCRKKCARMLPCKHHCQNQCSKPCGDCKVKLSVIGKKNVPDCNHEVEIECGIEPIREHCKRKCARILPCGHNCPSRCDQPCDQTKCSKIVDQTFDSPCGHKVQLPCNVFKQMQTGDLKPESLLQYCMAPCNIDLKCKHICNGTCSACHQGRLHAPCSQKCNQVNICGHQCAEPCNQVCPPCARACGVRCPHSACARRCGAPCVPCQEPCTRACPHGACTRRCGERCSRQPCDRRCPKPLPCGHPCRGLCGEPCPQVCKICAPEQFPTDLLGDPYDDDDKLVLLEDCGHYLDVDNLDTLMRNKTETIAIKPCPFCRAPIINTYRYKDCINKMFRTEINPIKGKVYGNEKQRRDKKAELLVKISGIIRTHNLALENKAWERACLNIFKIIKKCQNDTKISLLNLNMFHVYVDILENIGTYYIKYKRDNLTHLKPELELHMNLLSTFLLQNTYKISQQQQSDISNELKRINSIVQLAAIFSHGSYGANKSVPDVANAATAAKEAVFTWRVYNEDKVLEDLQKLENTINVFGIVSKEERALIVKAMDMKAGSWYKCPNGHFYCIGECGGAMEMSKCVECGAPIGGQNHRLTDGNQHAGEVDGSKYAAWSQEYNNMANFRLD